MSDAAGMSQRILVVDEDRALCESLDLLLESYEFELRTCRDVREARKVAADFAPGVVLVELKVPEADILRFCKEMRAVEPPAPVVLLTVQGLDAVTVGKAVASAGADGFVEKPFEAMAVLRRARSIAEERGDG